MLMKLNKLVVGLIVLTLSSVSSASQEKEWTFLTFLNGNNNLDYYGAKDINEMETVGSTDKIHVVVQWASYASTKTKRLYVHQDNTTSTVTSPAVETLGLVDMGDYKSLVEFIQWGVLNFPAKKYFVNVWDHGGGWHSPLNPLFKLFKGLNNDNPFTPSDISWDDHTGHYITTPQLGLAMAEAAKIIGHKVDLYGSDACLMAMPEVSTEMADSVSVFAGSQETEPGPGWDYGGFLKKWSALADMSAVNVAIALADSYVASYSGGSQGNSPVTFSAFDLTKTPTLLLAAQQLSTGLQALPTNVKQKIKTIIGNTQAFYYSDYGDALDFIRLMEIAGIGADLKPGILSTAKDALTGFIAYNKVSTAYNKAKGASLWIPKRISTFNQYWSRYQLLKFQQQTQWGNALQSILNSK